MLAHMHRICPDLSVEKVRKKEHVHTESRIYLILLYPWFLIKKKRLEVYPATRQPFKTLKTKSMEKYSKECCYEIFVVITLYVKKSKCLLTINEKLF